MRITSRSILVNSRAAISTTPIFRSDDPANFSKSRERRQITLDDVAKTTSELEHEKALKGLIVVEGAVDVGHTSVSILSC